MAVASLIYLMPLLAFFFVFIVSYALFAKTKILGNSEMINFFTSFLVAVIFFLSPAATKFTVTTIPWIAVLMFVLAFVLLILTFVQGKVDDLVKSPAVALILVAVVLLVFIAAAVNVFGPLINLITSGEVADASGPAAFFFSPSVLSAAALLVVAAITTYILTRSK